MSNQTTCPELPTGRPRARGSRLASNGFGLMALSALMAEDSYAGLAPPKLHFAPK